MSCRFVGLQQQALNAKPHRGRIIGSVLTGPGQSEGGHAHCSPATRARQRTQEEGIRVFIVEECEQTEVEITRLEARGKGLGYYRPSNRLMVTRNQLPTPPGLSYCVSDV